MFCLYLFIDLCVLWLIGWFGCFNVRCGFCWLVFWWFLDFVVLLLDFVAFVGLWLVVVLVVVFEWVVRLYRVGLPSSFGISCLSAISGFVVGWCFCLCLFWFCFGVCVSSLLIDSLFVVFFVALYKSEFDRFVILGLFVG